MAGGKDYKHDDEISYHVLASLTRGFSLTQQTESDKRLRSSNLLQRIAGDPLHAYATPGDETMGGGKKGKHDEERDDKWLIPKPFSASYEQIKPHLNLHGVAVSNAVREYLTKGRARLTVADAWTERDRRFFPNLPMRLFFPKLPMHESDKGLFNLELMRGVDKSDMRHLPNLQMHGGGHGLCCPSHCYNAPQQGAYNNQLQQRAYNNVPQQGTYNPPRQGTYNNAPHQATYNNAPHQGPQQGAYNNTPQQGAYSPPHQGAYYPPQQGPYYYSQQGPYYPPQQGMYYPPPQHGYPHQGSYYYPQQGPYYPPQQGSYYPPQQGIYYPPPQHGYPQPGGYSEHFMRFGTNVASNLVVDAIEDPGNFDFFGSSYE